jgi:hypothetical protein
VTSAQSSSRAPNRCRPRSSQMAGADRDVPGHSAVHAVGSTAGL